MTDWKLVPVEPTEEMRYAGYEPPDGPYLPERIWDAMLAAAPSADLTELRGLACKLKDGAGVFKPTCREREIGCELEALIEHIDGHPRTRG